MDVVEDELDGALGVVGVVDREEEDSRGHFFGGGRFCSRGGGKKKKKKKKIMKKKKKKKKKQYGERLLFYLFPLFEQEERLGSSFLGPD